MYVPNIFACCQQIAQQFRRFEYVLPPHIAARLHDVPSCVLAWHGSPPPLGGGLLGVGGFLSIFVIFFRIPLFCRFCLPVLGFGRRFFGGMLCYTRSQISACALYMSSSPTHALSFQRAGRLLLDQTRAGDVITSPSFGAVTRANTNFFIVNGQTLLATTRHALDIVRASNGVFSVHGRRYVITEIE